MADAASRPVPPGCDGTCNNDVSGIMWFCKVGTTLRPSDPGSDSLTSRLPVAEMSRRGRGATRGDVSRLAVLSRVGENFLQRCRLQHGYKRKKKKSDDYNDQEVDGIMVTCCFWFTFVEIVNACKVKNEYFVGVGDSENMGSGYI